MSKPIKCGDLSVPPILPPKNFFWSELSWLAAWASTRRPGAFWAGFFQVYGDKATGKLFNTPGGPLVASSVSQAAFARPIPLF
jgi:hypothetical protein